MPSSSARPSRSRKASSASQSSTTVNKTEVIINVYDLLPPGKLSSVLWTIGGSLLHSGVVIKGREYAYGGHNRRGVTGVYWTKPRFEPPGGTFRCDVLQGFTFNTEQEIDAIVKAVSEQFLGPSYNLLTHNCNHFTSALCERLASKPAPPWLNRAASIGLALPCVVPRDWISPPDHDTAEGELLDAEDEDDDEQAAMLQTEQRRGRREHQASTSSGPRRGSSLAGGNRLFDQEDTPPPRLVLVTDTSGREVPVAERAPVPREAPVNT